MYDLDLCHLGNQCGPGIIIDDILNIRKKTLFMLGIYGFNNILNFLKEANYEKIYDKKYLKKEANNHVRHSKYGFTFNHEYKIENSNFTNYDAVKDRFDQKIKNFREMLKNPKKTVFINVVERVDTLQLEDMVNWLKDNKGNFHLIIFTDKDYTTKYQSEHLSIIRLKNTFCNWWVMPDKTKACLYEEMYNNFIKCLEKKTIVNNFPKNYKDTDYGKAHPA